MKEDLMSSSKFGQFRVIMGVSSSMEDLLRMATLYEGSNKGKKEDIQNQPQSNPISVPYTSQPQS